MWILSMACPNGAILPALGEEDDDMALLRMNISDPEIPIFLFLVLSQSHGKA
jgi:hypothetical protein